ncbi:hypothetical protein RCL1_001215 [Eukaryota sp. TZLM3-RCL]
MSSNWDLYEKTLLNALGEVSNVKSSIKSTIATDIASLSVGHQLEPQSLISRTKVTLETYLRFYKACMGQIYNYVSIDFQRFCLSLNVPHFSTDVANLHGKVFQFLQSTGAPLDPFLSVCCICFFMFKQTTSVKKEINNFCKVLVHYVRGVSQKDFLKSFNKAEEFINSINYNFKPLEVATIETIKEPKLKRKKIESDQPISTTDTSDFTVMNILKPLENEDDTVFKTSKSNQKSQVQSIGEKRELERPTTYSSWNDVSQYKECSLAREEIIAIDNRVFTEHVFNVIDEYILGLLNS